MNRNRWIILLVGVVIIIASTAVITFNIMVKNDVDSRERVVVAKETIKKGDKLREDMMVYKYEDKGDIIPSIYQDKRDLVGKVVNTDIYPGEYILSHNINIEGKKNPNLRIMSIPVSLGGGAVGLTKGDYVDIFYVDKKMGEVRLFLPKVEVLELRDSSNYETHKNEVPSYIIFQTEYELLEDIIKANVRGSFFVVRYGEYSKAEEAIKEYERLKGIKSIKEGVVKDSKNR